MAEPRYWVFANKQHGFYGHRIWDMSWILENDRYTLKTKEKNRAHVRVGDIVYLRIYGDAYIGRFRVGGEWRPFPPDVEKDRPEYPEYPGTFAMADLVLWKRPVPQDLVIRDLSNGDMRSRVIRITGKDALLIEEVQASRERPGEATGPRLLMSQGNPNGNPPTRSTRTTPDGGTLIVLEEGLEELIKPNLRRMGLTLADSRICQQFSMGVGVGRSDLICQDEHGDLVVVELKRGKSSEQAVGQVLKYVGWLQENVAAEGQQVHGWLVAGDHDERVRLAAKAAHVKLWTFRLP